MKNFKIWSMAVVLLMSVVACGPDTPSTSGGGNSVPDLENIEKDWKLVSVNGVEPEFTVYLWLFDGLFSIYQQVYSLDYVMYDGDYTVSGNKLSGAYHDGTPWKCNYIGSVSEDGNTMTLVSDQLNPVTCVYEACVIPDDVIEEASTRSTELFDYFL